MPAFKSHKQRNKKKIKGPWLRADQIRSVKPANRETLVYGPVTMYESTSGLHPPLETTTTTTMTTTTSG